MRIVFDAYVFDLNELKGNTISMLHRSESFVV